MLTIKEASKMFKVSVPTIYRWILQDRISYKTELGQKFVDLEGLQKAYDSRRKTTRKKS